MTKWMVFCAEKECFRQIWSKTKKKKKKCPPCYSWSNTVSTSEAIQYFRQNINLGENHHKPRELIKANKNNVFLIGNSVFEKCLRASAPKINWTALHVFPLLSAILVFFYGFIVYIPRCPEEFDSFNVSCKVHVFPWNPLCNETYPLIKGRIMSHVSISQLAGTCSTRHARSNYQNYRGSVRLPIIRADRFDHYSQCVTFPLQCAHRAFVFLWKL